MESFGKFRSGRLRPKERDDPTKIPVFSATPGPPLFACSSSLLECQRRGIWEGADRIDTKEHFNFSFLHEAGSFTWLASLYEAKKKRDYFGDPKLSETGMLGWCVRTGRCGKRWGGKLVTELHWYHCPEAQSANAWAPQARYPISLLHNRTLRLLRSE